MNAHIPQADQQARQQWEIYERELRSWCTQTSLNAIEQCIHDELVKNGLSPTVFSDIQAPTANSTSSTPASPPHTPGTDVNVRGYYRTVRMSNPIRGAVHVDNVRQQTP